MSYIKAEIKKLKNSEIEIKAEISADILQNKRQSVLDKAVKEAEIPGFRKGQAPEKIVIEKIGEANLLYEAAEEAIRDAYPEIVTENKLEVIGRPEVSISKLAIGNNLEFKIKTAVMPEIKLGSYVESAKKELSGKLPEMEVTEKEVADFLEVMNKNKNSADKKKNPDTLPIPIDDDFAKSFGASDLNDLKAKIKESLKIEKSNKEKSKRRSAFIENIIAGSMIEVPEIIIQNELGEMIGRFKEDIKNAGMDFKSYLEKSKTSEEKIKNDWRPQAEKKAKTQMILNEIAKEQNIKPNQERVEKEVEAIMHNYPDANRESALIFVETALSNEAVFDYLENLYK